MPHAEGNNQTADTGFTSLVLVARFHGVAADVEQLKHRFTQSNQLASSNEILRATRHLGLKARKVSSKWERLAKMSLPALAQHNDGHWLVLAKVDENRILVQDPLESRPQTLPRDIFESAWNGTLILVTRRALLSNEGIKFGFRWFIPSIIKYRKLLSEVLVASFFLQLFALITPLFFQVVIDKVLVHKGLTTLDVLAFGLIVISIFEVILGGYAPTSSRTPLTGSMSSWAPSSTVTC